MINLQQGKTITKYIDKNAYIIYEKRLNGLRVSRRRVYYATLAVGTLLTLRRNHTGCSTKQESSAKLTNQRVSYAFTSSPLSFYARHILPTSKFQHSYSCILLIFYRHQ